MSTRAHLVLEHAIDQIVVGHSYRTDLGDLSELRASIESLGLLCPIVISVDNVLISGGRRLAVMRDLGRHTVPVWIATGVSDELRTVLAIQDEHRQRKDLTTTEQAALYAELKALLAEENARRQRATRFGAHPVAGADEADSVAAGLVVAGGGDSQPPHKRKSRVQAAQAVTGRDSSQQLEQVLELQRLATDETQDEQVRQAAAEAIVDVNVDGKVSGRFQDVKILQALRWLEQLSIDALQPAAIQDAAAVEVKTLAGLEHRAERARAATAATSHVTHLLETAGRSDGLVSGEVGEVEENGASMRAAYQCRRLVDLFTREQGWWATHDPALVGVYATEEQWVTVRDHLLNVAEFFEAAGKARANAVS